MNNIEGLAINRFSVEAIEPPKEVVPKRYSPHEVLNRYARLLDVGVGQVFRDEMKGVNVEQQNIALNQFEQGILENIRKQNLKMNEQVGQLEHALGNGLSSVGEQIVDCFTIADELSRDETPIKQAAARVASRGGLMLPITDFDNSATKDLSHLINLPTAQMEKRIEQNHRTDFQTDTLVTTHQVLKKDSAVIRNAGKTVVFRDGFPEFITETKDFSEGQNAIILSANYEHVIIGALSKLPEADGNIDYIAITDESILSTHKDKVLQYIARNNPQAALCFIGDGGSDEPALDADNVAFYFALKNSSFHKMCEERGVLYFTYDNFHDILKVLRKIKAEIPEMKERLQQAA